jgi:hypothetical protein
MARRRGGRIQVKTEGVAAVRQQLKAMEIALGDTTIVRIMQEGAAVMAASVQARAPRGATGNLARGIHTASRLRDNYKPLTRRGRLVTRPLKHKPRGSLVVVTSSAFYTGFVEKGKQVRQGPQLKRNQRRKGGVGRMRGRRFFNPGIQAARPLASSYIVRRIERFLQEKAR